NAMAIFAKKHFTRKRPDIFAGLINGSIYLSAAGAIAARFLRRALLPMLDVGLTLLILLLAQFHLDLLDCVIPVAFILSAFGLAGAYDLPVRLFNVVKGACFLFVLLW